MSARHLGLTLAQVEAWIAARRAEGMWVTCCQSCGSWFAQPRMGRRGVLCDRRVCLMAYYWRRKQGRMPPDEMWRRWRERYGDERRVLSATGRFVSSTRIGDNLRGRSL